MIEFGLEPPGSALSFWLVVGCTLAFELCVLRRLRFDWWIVGLVLASTLLCVDYLSDTSFDERNYDGSSHIEYIQWVATHHRVPDFSQCLACGHPPLYYVLGAVWSKLTGAWLPLELGLQWLSLLLFFGFVVFALLIFRTLSEKPSTLRLATALLVFWPSSIINSVRIHNDALVSLLMLAALYYIARWDRTAPWDQTAPLDRKDHPRDFTLALVASMLAIFTKASGYAVWITLLLVALARIFQGESRRAAIKQGATALLAPLSLAVLWVGLHPSRHPNSLWQKVFGHACDGRYVLPVPDSLRHFAYFDVRDFVLRMDTTPSYPNPDYFLNRLLKSSLFGVMTLGDEFGSEWHQRLATLISLLLLIMITVCLVGLPLLPWGKVRPYRAYWVGTVIMLACLVAFRIRVPNEFHEDFRHIFAALVPFCIGYVLVVERLRRFSLHLYRAGVSIAVLMVASSVAFFTRIR